MRKTRNRAVILTVSELEGRRLLSAIGPAGSWLGQDGHDLVGPSPVLGGDQVQDIHVAVSGLPTDRTVTSVDVQGHGGGEWGYQEPGNHWAAAWVATPGTSTADLDFEPYQVETGREFGITLTYDDHSTAQFYLMGGPADPNLRMPGTSITAGWSGQDGHDLTGPGPDVGPDGIQDLHVTLGNLTSGLGITAVGVTDPAGDSWAFGLNPALSWNAELVRPGDQSSQADLYFSPNRDLVGTALTVTVTYANGKTDSAGVVAGRTDTRLAMPAPAPVVLAWGAFSAQSVGQDGQDLAGPGSVHVALSGLPAGRSVVSATLSDESGADWSGTFDGGPSRSADPFAGPLAFARSAADPTHADLSFPPGRDESGATLTLRLTLDDGTMLATRFAGGPSDPGLRVPGIATGSVTAAPGDDLNVLANESGTVHLGAGTYKLDRPLILSHSVTITADPGTTLVFAQGAADPAWSTAIKIRGAHTTLDGFAVRFAGPIRWDFQTSYGPAVIGTTDNLDGGPVGLLVDINLTHLDVQAPPPSRTWEVAPGLIRLVTAQSGRIADDTLKGGSTSFMNGPWQVVDNDFRGTLPGTFAFDAFDGHYTHDVTVAGNHVGSVGPSGKTWRFLVLTQSGNGDVVAGNTVVGVGPQDSDTVPNPNAPEVILTEAYRLHFEGMPTAIAPDGLVVQIPTPQGAPARSGDVVSILSGPDAGQWRLIAQAISPTAYLLDAPLPTGRFAVSISTGFVNETFRGNTVDSRGSRVADDLVLAGNNFGTTVLDNHFLGGDHGFRIEATATESPNLWGWSHAPFLGGVIAGNTLEDTQQGGLLDVDHSGYIKSDAGRVYLSATLADNTVTWSDAFLTARAGAGMTGPLTGFTVGDTASTDPAELSLTASGNEVQGSAIAGPGAALQVDSGTVNGQERKNQSDTLPAVASAPEGLHPVDNPGASATAAPTAPIPVTPMSPTTVTTGLPPTVAPQPVAGPVKPSPPLVGPITIPVKPQAPARNVFAPRSQTVRTTPIKAVAHPHAPVHPVLHRARIVRPKHR